MPIIEIRGWVELAILLFLAARAVGTLIQKQDSSAIQHERDLASLREMVQMTFKNIDDKLDRASAEMSKWSGYIQGMETRIRSDYVEIRSCDDRMQHIAENLNRCQDRHQLGLGSKG